METENHNHLLSLGDISQEISNANISQEISNANTTSKPEPVFIFNLLLKPKAPYTSSIMKCWCSYSGTTPTPPPEKYTKAAISDRESPAQNVTEVAS